MIESSSQICCCHGRVALSKAYNYYHGGSGDLEGVGKAFHHREDRRKQGAPAFSPHGGLQPAHQKSTCLHAIHFRANLVTYPANFRDSKTRGEAGDLEGVGEAFHHRGNRRWEELRSPQNRGERLEFGLTTRWSSTLSSKVT